MTPDKFDWTKLSSSCSSPKINFLFFFQETRKENSSNVTYSGAKYSYEYSFRYSSEQTLFGSWKLKEVETFQFSVPREVAWGWKKKNPKIFSFELQTRNYKYRWIHLLKHEVDNYLIKRLVLTQRVCNKSLNFHESAYDRKHGTPIELKVLFCWQINLMWEAHRMLFIKGTAKAIGSRKIMAYATYTIWLEIT